MTLELTSSPSIELASSPPPVVHTFGDDERLPNLSGRVITAVIVGVPFLALAVGVYRFWGRGIGMRDVILAVSLYFLTGHGMSIGFHRLLAHKSFSPNRPLKIGVVALGSMAFEGGPISWVANHRRHHVFADTVDDPHSPQHHGPGSSGQLKGLWHAHVGWLFTARSTSRERHAADLMADRDIVVIDALFPFWCVVSLALPFGLGWLLGGTLAAAMSALLWAGLVRICVLHHADVERQLRVSHVRTTTVRDQGSQHQRGAARSDQHGRVVAQHPPCVPALGPPWPAPPPVGFVGDADPCVRADVTRP